MKTAELRKLIASGQITVEGGKIPATPPPELARANVKGGRGIRRAPGEMNKLEAQYAAHLDVLKHAGEVRWYGFEAVKFRLAENTSYTPDFLVMTDDNGLIECHEVKGPYKKTYFCEDDAKVKIKVAAAMFPFVFVIVWPCKQHGWNQEVF